MGGIGIAGDWVVDECSNKVRNMVLVGRTGNGKSATGNSILGRKAFKSKISSSGVTGSSEMQRTVLDNGIILKVIDTPGLFDFSLKADYIVKEILNCIRLAKNGIHAIIAVFSVRNRFSEEESAIFKCLQTFFGPKLVDYMIIVFTGGDDLQDETLEGYIGDNCPDSMKEILGLCKNRVVLFDNKTKAKSKKDAQVKELLAFVEQVAGENDGHPYHYEFFLQLTGAGGYANGGHPYSYKILPEFKEGARADDNEFLRRIIELIERLENELKAERAARLEAEERLLEMQAEQNKSGCVIL